MRDSLFRIVRVSGAQSFACDGCGLHNISTLRPSPHRNQEDAFVAARSPLAGPSLTLWTYRVSPAPAPEDVNWQSLWTPQSSKIIRSVIMVIPSAIAILFPIGVITG